ncbi:hypothetical protein PR202_gb09398 [Eleusine coracana subsp. coracana]|uniref:Glycosyltransferase n=1 Tax=Eleusine coracana subsp. coracana TaxID=191504 RepID=A0AAV5EHA8_ELECO|nr:hypothetical protein PR202_gb09398 [Eleusine coracana subsp. coracana]
MANKTVILTTLNSAWASPGSVIDLFINSFRHGVRTSSLLRHLVIVTFDWKAYKRCVKIHPYCFALVTKDLDFSQEKRFLTSGYLEMMWKRLDFLQLVLEKGYSFVFTDADIMWFRNPFPYFYPEGDFQIACDHYVGNATDLRNIANGGFNYVKSNEQSIEFYKFWYSSRLRYPGYHDQDVFNFIKHDPYITDICLTIKFLSTMYFGGICEPSRDLNKVCTMHANCCIGLQSKLHDLRILMEDWRNYMSMSPSLKTFGALSWRVPQNCRCDAASGLNLMIFF